MAKEFGSLILPDFAWAHWLRVAGSTTWAEGDATTGHECAIRAACLPDIHIDQQQSQQRV